MITLLAAQVTTAHGGKVAGLGKLLAAGARVPPGFVIDAARTVPGVYWSRVVGAHRAPR